MRALACLAFAVIGVLAVGCVDPNMTNTDGMDGSGTPDPLQQAANAVAKSPALFVCREACWTDIPYNACADQRDACLAKAGDDKHAKKQCRKMSRTCRKERRSCLKSCKLPGNIPALHKPETAPAADDPADDAPGDQG